MRVLWSNVPRNRYAILPCRHIPVEIDDRNDMLIYYSIKGTLTPHDRSPKRLSNLFFQRKKSEGFSVSLAYGPRQPP